MKPSVYASNGQVQVESHAPAPQAPAPPAPPLPPPPREGALTRFLRLRRFRLASRAVGKGRWEVTTAEGSLVALGFRHAGNTFGAHSLSDEEARNLYSLLHLRPDEHDAGSRHALSSLLDRCTRGGQLFGADLDIAQNAGPGAAAVALDYARRLDLAGAEVGIAFRWHQTNPRGGLHGDVHAPEGLEHRLLAAAAGELLRRAAEAAGVPIQTSNPHGRPDVTLDLAAFYKRGRGSLLRLAGADKEPGGFRKVPIDIYAGAGASSPRQRDRDEATCSREALLAAVAALEEAERLPRAPSYLRAAVRGEDVPVSPATPEDMAWLGGLSTLNALWKEPAPGQSRYDRDWFFARAARRFGADFQRIGRLLTSIPRSRVTPDRDGRRHLEGVAGRLKRLEAVIDESASWQIQEDAGAHVRTMPAQGPRACDRRSEWATPAQGPRSSDDATTVAMPAPGPRSGDAPPPMPRWLSASRISFSGAARDTIRALAAAADPQDPHELRADEAAPSADQARRLRALRVAGCGALITKRVCEIEGHGDQDRRPLFCGHEGICPGCADRYASAVRSHLRDNLDPARVAVFVRLADAESVNERIEESRRAKERANRFFVRHRRAHERRWILGVESVVFIVATTDAARFQDHSDRNRLRFKRFYGKDFEIAEKVYDVLMEPSLAINRILEEGGDGELEGNPFWKSQRIRRYDAGRVKVDIPWLTHSDLAREKSESARLHFLEKYGIDEPWDPSVCHCVQKLHDGRHAFCGHPLYHAVEYQGQTIAASEPGSKHTWRTERRALNHLGVIFRAESRSNLVRRE